MIQQNHERERRPDTIASLSVFPWLAWVLAFCASCAAPTPMVLPSMEMGQSAGVKRPPRAVPEYLVKLADQSSDLGAELFNYYDLASVAMDILITHGQPVDMIDAFLTAGIADDDGKPTKGYSIAFSTRSDPPRLAYSVTFPVDSQWRFKRLNPPQALGRGVLEMFLAQRTALAAIPKPSGPVARIILTGDALNKTGFLVYVLADSMQKDAVVFGMHYRVVVDFDGVTVREVQPLSTSATVRERMEGESQTGADSPGLSTVDDLFDWPLETHVFLSLKHGGLPIQVKTDEGLWRVTGTKVEAL